MAVEIEGRKVPVSNLDKLMYPADGITKGDVINYYVRVSRYLLPHFKDRPVTLIRYPDGVAGEHFYEKHAPAFTPDWVQTVDVPRRAGGTPIRYILINDLPTLVWCVNLAAIELHPSLALAKDIKCPTELVFDLDPGPPANIVQCCQVAMWLREIFELWELQCFPKTSGSKGLQVYVPLNTPTTYDLTKPFAHALARLLEQESTVTNSFDVQKWRFQRE